MKDMKANGSRLTVHGSRLGQTGNRQPETVNFFLHVIHGKKSIKN
jgi:hypothetical protein